MGLFFRWNVHHLGHKGYYQLLDHCNKRSSQSFLRVRVVNIPRQLAKAPITGLVFRNELVWAYFGQNVVVWDAQVRLYTFSLLKYIRAIFLSLFQ